ncbi:MAG: DUF1559 domain-containing protein [Gemmataceae bacterium]
MALAMYNYQDDHGRLPPAVVYGENGEPLYSWRVLILPYIEQNEVYNKFKLNEPWDSPHNYELLSEMPRAYAPPSGKRSKAPAYYTFCKVFVGQGAAFEGQKGLRLPADFPDGTSNTILIAEAGEPVPWTMPQDLPYDPELPLPDLRGLFKDGFRAGMADGSMRWLKWDISDGTLRAAITRNGEDKVGPDW